jgi:beta-N-acetylhexosaminidase
VLAIAAGADAICVGGGLADDETVRRLRDALVSAVRAGELPEERLADAANRVRALAGWTATAATAFEAAPVSLGGRAVTGTVNRAAVTGGSRTAPGPHHTNGSNGSNASNGVNGSNGPVDSNASNVSGAQNRSATSNISGAPSGTGASNRTSGAADVGLVAARRALTVTRSASCLPLAEAPFVAALTPVANIAVGDETPWGVAAELVRLIPGTATGSFTGEDAGTEALAAAGARPVVAVVRDEHRHPWMAAALDTLLAARPDTVVVEMGVPQSVPRGALHIATHGAARVCGRAAAEVIAAEADAGE